MSRWFGSPRGTESPMDFEYTSRPTSGMKPVWATSSDHAEDPTTPKKRPLGEVNPPASPFPGPHTPTFGRIQNVPFMLNIPPPHTPQHHAWAPPPQVELNDVDMSEPSPPQPSKARDTDIDDGEKGEENDRQIAIGGLRRVFRSRQRNSKEKSRLGSVRRATVVDADEEDADSDEYDEDGRAVTPITQNTSNHYTLNLPGPAATQSETPYVLLGYLQFFFNLSLVLLFLYVLVQFILTVQRDVEHRISEYSMDVVQEIAQCAIQFKTNLCANNAVPAMAYQCGLWETCMNRDPTKVGRARIGAELIAEVVNGFVEPISWKTLIFTLTSLSFLTVFVNTLLSLYRSRHNPAHQQTPAAIPAYPVAHLPLPPNTPYAHPSQHMIGTPGWGKSWTGTNPEVEETPARRRKLENGAIQEVK